MTVFRLATATVLLSGLALPVLAQGLATPAPAVPGNAAVTRGMAAPAAPISALPTQAVTNGTATNGTAMNSTAINGTATNGAATNGIAANGIAKTHATTAQAVVTPGAGDAGMARAAPVATPSAPHADAGAVQARPGRTEAVRVERTERRSHHRFASATRMERTRMSHGQPAAGDAASDATR